MVGNGVETNYSYDPRNRRLATLNSAAPGDPALQALVYSYDAVGNILGLANNAPVPPSNTFGGPTGQTFQYDDLYRLVSAQGFHQGAHERNDYTLAMSYDATHNITHKNQHHWVTRNGGKPLDQRATTYDWAYSYRDKGQTQPHAPSHIGNRSFTYDANGNQTGWTNDQNGTRRTIVWDEENRIREVQDPRHATRYVYDGEGERKLKYGQYGETAYINQFFTVRNGAIASAHIFAGTTRVATKLNAGTPVGKTTGGQGWKDQSLLTTDTSLSLDVTGTGQGNNGNAYGHNRGNSANATTTSGFPGQGLEHRAERANEVAQNTEKNKHLNGGTPGGEHGAGNSNAGGNGNNGGGNSGNNGNGGGNSGDHGNSGGMGQGNGGNGQGGGSTGSGEGREFLYYFHPDHLGSSSYVTDANAKRYEHLEYFPFGETFVEDNGAKWRTLYHYTSKPIDPEVQLYYFGARYYDPRTSVWQSGDPVLASYLPNRNSDANSLRGIGGIYRSININLYLYHYSGLNPLKIVDPDGNEDIIAVTDSQSTNNQLSSIAMVYKDTTLSGNKLTMLKAWGAVKNAFGGSVTEKDVKFFFGEPEKSFDKFSTVSQDPEQYGTVKAGEMYSYKQKDMSWTTNSFVISSDLGEGKVPQDSRFNNGINPNNGGDLTKNFLTEVYMHPARGGQINDTYLNGSQGCSVRYGFAEMFNYLNQSPTGMEGRYMIMR